MVREKIPNENMACETKGYNRAIRTRKISKVTYGTVYIILAARKPHFHLVFILFAAYSKLYADVHGFCGSYESLITKTLHLRESGLSELRIM